MQSKTRTYEDHNKVVLEYFKDRPNDLLVFCWEDGDSWDKLCAFLRAEVPDTPIPHLNKGSYHKVIPPWLAKIEEFYAFMLL